ncbi:hypothetical protein ACFFX0_26740 [Citricoccus parietis]|uniref:Uncharacterized protein n=1 Tax=Citricoccus parietis TaxID=592307 RepID=A0ABV5G6M0_9MICC
MTGATVHGSERGGYPRIHLIQRTDVQCGLTVPEGQIRRSLGRGYPSLQRNHGVGVRQIAPALTGQTMGPVLRTLLEGRQ